MLNVKKRVSFQYIRKSSHDSFTVRMSATLTFNGNLWNKQRTKTKLTVRAEVIYQDYFLNKSWRTSHQNTIREKKSNEIRFKTQVTQVCVLAAAWVGGSCSTSLPFDSSEESGTSFIVESDDDAGGGKVCSISQSCTSTKRRGGTFIPFSF